MISKGRLGRTLTRPRSMEVAIRGKHSLYGPFEKKRIRAKTNVFNIMYFWMQLMRTTRVFDDSAQGLRGGAERPRGARRWLMGATLFCSSCVRCSPAWPMRQFQE
ncbi:hypothetical protein D3C86_869550 [compost metagenome]